MKNPKNKVIKYGPVILFVLVFVALTAFFLIRYPDNMPVSFSIDGYDADIEPWRRRANDYVVFVPSFCDTDDIVVKTDDKDVIVTIDGETYKDGDKLKNISKNGEYTCKISGRQRSSYTCRMSFYKASNVHTLFVDTATGSMKNVLSKKGKSEDASVSLFDDKGDMKYSDENASIKGRGNGSWNADKKSYLLTFGDRVSLFGMRRSDKYVLLANAADETNLRNKIIYDIANAVFEEWTPRCEYVDLYLNGEYNGLYLLCEKIEATEEKLADSDCDPLSFLCEINFGEDDLPTVKEGNQFISREKQLVQIEYTTDGITKDDVEELTSLMERGIMEGDFSRAALDYDSWAKKYIIDEFSENGDADIRSSWFYCRDDGGKPTFYAGPIWDYDYTLGRSLSANGNPETFTARRKYRSKTQYTPYYSALCENKEFDERLRSIYKDVFRPAIDSYLENYRELAESISDSAQMNRIRWSSLFEVVRSGNRSTVVSPEELYDYIAARLRFLDSAWIDGTDYKLVQIESKELNAFFYFSVKKGDALPLEDVGRYIDTNDEFTELRTGEGFDLGSAVERDMILVGKSGASAAKPSAFRDKNLLLCGGIFFVLVLLLIAFIITDRRRRRGK